MRRLLLLPSLLFFAGCGDDGTGPDPSDAASIEISAPTVSLEVGDTATLTTAIRDPSGATLSGLAVTWESRDTTTLVVDPSGLVTGVRMGEAWIVGGIDGLADSVLLAVFHPTALGEARVRVTGRESFEARYGEAGAVFIDFLGRDDADYFQALSVSESGDTVLAVLQGGMPNEGVTELRPVDPEFLTEGKDGRDLPGPSVWIVIEESFDAVRVLLSGRGRLEVELDDVPAGPGTRPGALRARVVTELHRYRVRFEEQGAVYEPLPGLDTLVADLNLPFDHWPVGNSSGTIEGGPDAGAWDLRETWWFEGGPEGLSYLDVEDGPPSISATTPLAGTGTVPVADSASADPGDPRASVRMMDYSEFTYQALSTSGTFSVTRFVEPSGSLFGVVEGEIEADLTGRPLSDGASFPMRLTMEFQAPLIPRGSPAGSPPRVTDRVSEGLRAVLGPLPWLDRR